MCFKVAQKNAVQPRVFYLYDTMMIFIAMLFLGRTFNNFDVPRLCFKVAHPKVQCNPM